MNSTKKLFFNFSQAFAFLVLLISCICLLDLYLNRNEAVLIRDENEYDKYMSIVWLQNPFRDKSKEIIADEFLNSIKGKSISDSLTGDKNVVIYPCIIDQEKGKLAKWDIWNRFDNENETELVYRIFRENPDKLRRPKNNKFLLSFYILKLIKEDTNWKVKEFNCNGLSNNS